MKIVMSRSILMLFLATVVAGNTVEFDKKKLLNDINNFNFQLCSMRYSLLGDLANNLPSKVCNYSARNNYTNIKIIEQKLFSLISETSGPLSVLLKDSIIPQFNETFGPLKDEIFENKAIVFENINQLYKNAMDLVIKFENVAEYKKELLELHSNFLKISRNNPQGKSINDMLRRIHNGIFQFDGTEEDFLAFLHQECQDDRCNTIKSLEQLKTVYELLLVAELKAFIAGIHFDFAHDFFINYSSRVLSFMRLVIPSTLERIQNYIASIEYLAQNVSLKYCQPFSWKIQVTTQQNIYPSIYNDNNHVRGSLRFTINKTEKVELTAFTNTRNFLRIWFNDESVSVSYNGQRVHDGIPKKNPRSSGYWIEWSDNSMSLGQLGVTKPLLTHSGDDYRELAFFHVFEGNWLFYDLPPRSRQEEQKIRNCWVAPQQPLTDSVISDKICRISYNDLWIPGYYNQSTGLCYGAHEATNQTISNSDFQVLIKPSQQQWVNPDSSSLATAVLGGIGELGEPRFICRSKCQSRVGYIDFNQNNCVYNQDECTASAEMFRVLLQDN